MNRRGFLSSLVAATSAIVGVSVGARALPQQAPIPDEFTLNNVNKVLGEFDTVPWKVETRSVVLNEEWMDRVGEQRAALLAEQARTALNTKYALFVDIT